jgi:hypothetical protein
VGGRLLMYCSFQRDVVDQPNASDADGGGENRPGFEARHFDVLRVEERLLGQGRACCGDGVVPAAVGQLRREKRAG